MSKGIVAAIVAFSLGATALPLRGQFAELQVGDRVRLMGFNVEEPLAQGYVIQSRPDSVFLESEGTSSRERIAWTSVNNLHVWQNSPPLDSRGARNGALVGGAIGAFLFAATDFSAYSAIPAVFIAGTGAVLGGKACSGVRSAGCLIGAGLGAGIGFAAGTQDCGDEGSCGMLAAAVLSVPGMTLGGIIGMLIRGRWREVPLI